MVDDLYNLKNVFTGVKSIYEEYFENDLQKYEVKCTKFFAENHIIQDKFETNCKKGMKYLDYLEEQSHIQYENIPKAMLYLYCWLYDKELYKEMYSNNEVEIYKSLIKEYDDDGNSNLPQIFRDKVEKKLNDKLKKVYDLYYQFDKFINSKDDSNSCEIAEECVNSYTSYNDNCNAEENTDFCAGVKEFEEYYISYVKKNNICHGSIIYIIFVKNRIVLTIMITILITLIATFILFFRYKVINNFKLMYVH
ncbi:hypothetical protein PVBG_02442 [Plasmodium vivax Brazil I]|uniref:Variable surface protein n=1 Tax=Plasmodium vivax (strain Brazil I) TaxID=1033975 RepID=A0A0J9SM59_PLAV1|nr:hypothetical protein PVBG_02442 [Plasmodium vivax Brazil I]